MNARERRRPECGGSLRRLVTTAGSTPATTAISSGNLSTHSWPFVGHDEGVAEENAEHAVGGDRVGLGHDDHAGLEHLVDLVRLGALGEDVRLVGDDVDAVHWVGRDCTPLSRKNLLACRMLSVGLPGLISAMILL